MCYCSIPIVLVILVLVVSIILFYKSRVERNALRDELHQTRADVKNVLDTVVWNLDNHMHQYKFGDDGVLYIQKPILPESELQNGDDVSE